MECLWNNRHLERPPRRTVSTHKIDARGLVSALRTAIHVLRSQDALQVETAILGRLVYRMKMKFRSDKGLENTEKVKRALTGYSSLALTKEYQRLVDCVRTDGQLSFLPSKQMLQHALVRTLSFAKLTRRVESTTWRAANFFKKRIQLGHAWTISLVAYAVLARIWTLSRYLIESCCVWYGDVCRYANALETIGAPWLPKDHPLPADLRVWLDLASIDDETRSVSLAGSNETGAIFRLLEVHGVEEGPRVGATFATNRPSSIPTSDIGSPIDRRTFEPNPRDEGVANGNIVHEETRQVRASGTSSVRLREGAAYLEKRARTRKRKVSRSSIGKTYLFPGRTVPTSR